MVVVVTDDKITINGISAFWGIEENNKRMDGFAVYESVYTVGLKKSVSDLAI